MNKKILSLLQYVFFFGLGIFLVWWSLGKISPADWKEIQDAFLGTDYLMMLPVSLALLLSHYSRAVRWRILIGPLGHKPRMANTYIAVLVGYLANLALPRLGEILKCTLLARYEKIPAEKLVGTIVAERAFDLLCLMLTILAAFLLQRDLIGSYLTTHLNTIFNKQEPSSGNGNLLLLLAAGSFILVLIIVLMRRNTHHNFLHKTKVILQGIWHGLTSVRHIRNKGWFIFHTLFIWTMYLVSIQLGALAMQGTHELEWMASLSMLATGSIAMILTPSGIGAYPIFIEGTLALYGIKSSIGIALGWMMWAVQFFLMLIAGFLALAVLPYFNKKQAHAQP